MTLRFRETQTQFETMIVAQIDEPTVDTIRAAVNRAERRIAPLWPLRYFVAVNPYLGLLEQPFEAAAQILARELARA